MKCISPCLCKQQIPHRRTSGPHQDMRNKGEENQGHDPALLMNKTTEKDRYWQAPNSVDIRGVEHIPLCTRTIFKLNWLKPFHCMWTLSTFNG